MNVKNFEPYHAPGIRNGNCCIVTIKNGTQVLTMPDGTVIPAQVWSRVTTDARAPSHAIVKLLVNVRNLDEVPFNGK